MSNFFLLTEYIKWEIQNGFHREDYLAAILATETRRSYVKEPNKVKVTDFLPLLKFNFDNEKQEDKTLSVEERTNRAKQFAFAIAGMIGKGKKFIKTLLDRLITQMIRTIKGRLEIIKIKKNKKNLCIKEGGHWSFTRKIKYPLKLLW